MTAQEFLDQLEQRAWVPGEVVTSLRKQVAASAKPVAPETLAKLLVGKQRLTAAQAQQLLVVKAPQLAASKPAAPELTAEDLGLPSLLDEELGLAPLEEESQKAFGATKTAAAKPAPAKPAAPSPGAAKSPAGNKGPAVKPVAAKPGRAQPGVAKTVAKGPASGKAASAIAPAAEDPFGLGAFGSTDDLLSAPSPGDAAASMQGNPLMPMGRQSRPIPTWIWLASGGGLLAIVALVVVLKIVGRNTGDPQWKLAEKDYQAGADQDAIYKLEAFLELFPHHAQASLARVYEGMARLRMAWAAKTDWQQPLAVARDVLPRIVREPEFPKVREDLAKLLPDMAAGLSKQAQAGANASLEQRRQLVELAEQGFALANDWRFVPAAQKPWAEMQATEDQLAHLARDLARDTELQKALSGIRTAINTGHASDGLADRDHLLQEFPELRQDSSLDGLNQELAKASIKLVKIDTQTHAAETKPRGTPIIKTLLTTGRNEAVALSSAGGKANPAKPASEMEAEKVGDKTQAAAPAVSLLVGGTIYWLMPNDGSIVGRQFVGFESVPPLAVGVPSAKDNEPQDTILFDGVHQELVRYAPEGTELRWRLTIGDALDSPPLLTEKQLFVATRTGKLILVDAETGKWLRMAQLPVRLRTAPAISADGTTLYLVADAGILFVMSAKDLSVTAAMDLGHASGSVVLSPSVFAGHLVVVENSDWDNSTLRLLRPSTAKPLPKIVQSLALTGQVTSQPVIAGSRMFVATNAGTLLVLGPAAVESPTVARSGGESSAPLKAVEPTTPAKQAEAPVPVKMAEIPAVKDPPAMRFVAINGKQIWLAGLGVTRYELDEAGGLLTAGWNRLADRIVQQPPQLSGDTLIVAGRRKGWPGLWISGLDAAAGRTRWEIALGAPPAGLPLRAADGGTLRMAQSLVDFVALADGTLALVERHGMPGSSAELASGSALSAESRSNVADYLVIADTKKSTFRPSPWTDALAAPPIAFVGGLLVANPAGQIGIINVASGQLLSAPFQSPTRPGAELHWCMPAVVPEKLEVVVTDGEGNIYRLGITDKPVPNLAALATNKLPAPPMGEVAVCGEFAIVADREGNLSALGLADLKPAKSWPLGGRAVWGPRRVGQAVLVATERELFCIDKHPELAWRLPLEGGLPVDTPLVRGSEFLMATADGFVSRVDFASGEVRKKVNLEQPLAGGPVASGADLLLSGSDGSLFFIRSP